MIGKYQVSLCSTEGGGGGGMQCPVSVVQGKNNYIQYVCSPSRSQLMTGKYEQGGLLCPVSVIQDNTSIIVSCNSWIKPGRG